MLAPFEEEQMALFGIFYSDLRVKVQLTVFFYKTCYKTLRLRCLCLLSNNFVILELSISNCIWWLVEILKFHLNIQWQYKATRTFGKCLSLSLVTNCERKNSVDQRHVWIFRFGNRLIFICSCPSRHEGRSALLGKNHCGNSSSVDNINCFGSPLTKVTQNKWFALPGKSGVSHPIGL